MRQVERNDVIKSDQPGSGPRQGGFLEQAAERAEVDEQVGEGDVGSCPGQAIRPDPFEAQASDLGIATLDKILAAGIVGFPEIRAVRIEPCQPFVVGAVGMEEGALKMTYLP